MKRALALLGITALLSACTQQRAPAPTANRSVATLSIVVGGTISVKGSITASRLTSMMFLDTTTWTLQKKAVDDGLENTAAFEVSVHRTDTRTQIGNSVTTTVASDPGTPLQVCNDASSVGNAVVNPLSFVVYGVSGGSDMPNPVPVSSSLPDTPFSLAPGACVSANFSVVSTDAGLSADQKTMLNSAEQFKLVYSAQADVGGVIDSKSGSAGPVSIDEKAISGIGLAGDQSVTLTDPTFGFTQVLTGDFTKTFSRAFTCDNKTGLRADTADNTKFYLDNTAYLKGDTTDLQASATDTVTLHCATGCTYTQGYYKTHAQYFKGALNKKYDVKAWNGAYNWNGAVMLNVGGVMYTQKQITDIYDTAPAGNQAIALFHQLATAKLNLLKTNPSGPHPLTAAAMSAADAWFAANPGWQNGTYSGNPSQWISILDAFNNGYDSAHCG